MINNVDIINIGDKYFDVITYDKHDSIIVLNEGKILKEPYLERFKGYEIDIIVLTLIEVWIANDLKKGVINLC